jgi:hypothetical protein
VSYKGKGKKIYPFTLSQALFLLRFGQLVVWIDDYLVNAL